MKTLIAVKSSMKAWMGGYHEPIRETWGKQRRNCTEHNHVHLKFLFGNDAVWLLGPYHDEVNIDVADDYYSLSLKANKILEYSL